MGNNLLIVYLYIVYIVTYPIQTGKQLGFHSLRQAFARIDMSLITHQQL